MVPKPNNNEGNCTPSRAHRKNHRCGQQLQIYVTLTLNLNLGRLTYRT